LTIGHGDAEIHQFSKKENKMKITKTPLDEGECKALGDHVFWVALKKLEKAGVPPEISFDRMGTAFLAHVTTMCGKAQAAGMLKHMAKLVEDGIFDHISGESRH
jgi:hypothetical protein